MLYDTVKYRTDFIHVAAMHDDKTMVHAVFPLVEIGIKTYILEKY